MTAIGYAANSRLEVKQAETGEDRYLIFKRGASAIWDIPVRLVYYNNARLRTLTPAWEVQMMDVFKKHYWLAYVDAITGIILEKRDLIIHCTFGGPLTDANMNRVLDPATEAVGNSAADELPSENLLPTNQYRVFNLPFESPIDPGASHSLVTKSGDTLSSPDGWHKQLIPPIPLAAFILCLNLLYLIIRSIFRKSHRLI
jgi:hypothetical protein